MSRSISLRACCFPAVAALGILLGSVHAEDSIQTGDGLLKVSAKMPDEARTGESFTYNVTVTNVSDNVVLHDVKLEQRQTQGLSIESVSLKESNQHGSGNKKTGKKSSDKESSGNQSSESKSSSEKQMMVSTLKPGQSRTFAVKATADEEGDLRSCLEIASYRPALCLSSKVVKPQLELTKKAPEKSNRCDVIKLEYTLKNGGSGDVGQVKVTDSLGDGLATIDGDSDLKFDVDGLKAGDSRRFVVRVYAKKAGEFSSRATAKATDSDLQSRSKETTTKVIAADLAAKLNGPKRLYGEELARFTAEITNTGNVAAENVKVKVQWPSEAKLADLGDPTMSKSEQADSDQGSDDSGGEDANSDDSDREKQQGQPTPAKTKTPNSSISQESKGKSDDSAQDMSEDSLVIERLDPGQTASFEYAVRPGSLEELSSKVTATYVCDVDSAEDQAKAKARAESSANANVSIVRLPALQIMVVDAKDPLEKGSEAQYSIRVWNEGDAVDNQVQVTAELPDGLEFVSADGPTKNSQDGSTVKFDPIKSMKPGDKVDYKVNAKVTGDKDVIFKAGLTSEHLSSKVSAEEPTQLFTP